MADKLADNAHPLMGLDLSGDPLRRARQQELIHGVQRGLHRSSIDADLLPITPQLTTLFGEPGLPLGSTVLVAGKVGQGATSLALHLCARVTQESFYVGVVNLSRVGLVGCSELDVALDHLVFIARPTDQVAKVAAMMMESCLLVIVGSDRPVPRRDAERLQRRARERRCVLLVLDSHAGEHRSFWTEVPDITLVVTGGRAVGIGHGGGALLTRELHVEVRYRRLLPQGASPFIFLPGLSEHSQSEQRLSEQELTPVLSDMHLVG
jgi:hypothetical protein